MQYVYKSFPGIKFANISELSRHLMAAAMQHAPPGPASSSPPPLGQPHVPPDEAASRQLITQLKRKIQGTPGRPKKKKAQEAGESPPSTSYVHHQPVKHEEPPESYGYQPPYMPVYDVRPPYPAFGPPRAHPPAPGEYRPDTYPYEQQGYARDLSLPDPALNLPINLSSDARDAAERTEWARRRPPEPPPRLPLPGKKLILETYQSETQGGSPRAIPEPRPPPVQEEFPRAEYLPKKMRAAEISGGKLAAQRHAAASDGASTSTEPTLAFLEDPKNLTSRSKSTAAALARDIQEAASPKRVKRAPTPRQVRGPRPHARPRGSSADRARSPDTCCGLDGINIKTGVICDEKHTEILNRERVISICNIDKHDLDDYLNEGNSQEHEEELLKYFQAKEAEAEVPPVAVASAPAPACGTASFSETNQDPQDDHSQGKNEKISQLRELLAKNLKSQNSSSQSVPPNQEQQPIKENSHEQTLKLAPNDGAFKPLADVEISNGPQTLNQSAINGNKMFNSVPNENGTAPPLLSSGSASHGNCHNDPQSPTSRTQQYDFVPISDGCQSPANFNSKSPVGFGQRGLSPTKINKSIMSNSLQTSPISHSTAASPFVSPRNTPVPRSRLCSRPIPKLNGRKRRNPLSLGVSDQCHKQFAIPNDQKFMSKMPVCGPGKFCQSIQPMSAPPSPNILTSQYKTHMFHCAPNIPNGVHNLSLNFLPNVPIRDHIDRELAQPLSADPLSSEVSQFFQEPLVNYRPAPDSFRSQSVPLKQGINNMCLLSYNNTPVGSVPPTPVPNEFCDFGSLADTCDISKAGLNPETLDKIYNAIDSSNDVLNTNAAQTLLNSNDALTNGCDPIPEQAILSDEQLNSLIPSGEELLDRGSQFSQPFNNDAAPTDNVEDFLKRPNSIEFDLSELETDKNKYYTSRSVPSTPLPFKRTASNLQIDSCRSRELFPADAYTNASNGISSKSVPSTPQMVEERSVFSYSNRDYLINGNSVGGSAQMHDIVMDNDQSLASPLNDMLREDMLNPLTPALLADLDKMDTPYVDL
ncbi:unnamed protein product [Diatraea saccharalis]|uniref:Uncharacterized protein n=1 Tax=Diatraea saccharalis TaxID=40085 RepID=A0A9P0C506_9NEOP|nr:unnamed protein product [Diatraea saccharalis]